MGANRSECKIVVINYWKWRGTRAARERMANTHQLPACKITSLSLQTGYHCVAWPGLELTLLFSVP